MQSWADHCSSDDESDDERPTPLPPVEDEDDLSYENDVAPSTSDLLDEDLEEEEEYPPAPQPLDLPALLNDPAALPEGLPGRAPYTAHIGNLAFTVVEPEDLATKVEELVKDRYQGSRVVKVTQARVGIDRETGKRKGFGYVEFDTVEELLILLNLNDGCSEINQRRIRLDIAQPPRNRRNNRNNNNYNDRNHADIDGSQFRGGKFSQASQKRTERPGLKLAPRTKPVEANSGGGSRSDIFGNAKPREGEWRSSRSMEEKTGGNGGGRGGRGRGGGGRAQRRGSHNQGGRGGGQARRGSRTEKKKEAAPPAALPVVAKETKSVTKTANSFAALGFDSDSD